MGIREDIAVMIAALPRTVPVPTGELGYGTDLSCVADLSPTMDEVNPFSTVGIAQALIRRATTPRGQLPDDPDYGYSIRGFLNRGTTIAELRNISAALRNEWRKDDRVLDVSVTVDATGVLSTKTLRISAQVIPADPKLNPFALVFAVTADGVELLETIA